MPLETILNKKQMQSSADLVDTIDLINGPLCYLLLSTGSKTLENIGIALSVSEILFSKIPFVTSYLRQTKDYKSLIYWVPKEVLCNSIPINGLLDIFPAYRWRTEVILK
jgi:hypothetical protein